MGPLQPLHFVIKNKQTKGIKKKKTQKTVLSNAISMSLKDDSS